jgi:membrane fusion protein, copper/silver efflux system
MSSTKLTLSAIALAALVASIYGSYELGVTRGSRTSTAPMAPVTAGERIDAATGKRVLYWHDPMVPGTHFDAPGQSPFMDMALVAVFADGDDGSDVTVSARVQQNLGVRTAEVVREALTTRIAAVGTIAFNERDQALVQARATGYVERLRVRAPLEHVAAGQPLIDLYVPEWVAAQEEFLAVRRLRGEGLDPLVDAARQRMRQAGMPEELIRTVADSNTLQPRSTLTAPIDGVVAELDAREGMTVLPGTMLFRIYGLATVWANVAVPASQAGRVHAGATVQGRTAAAPSTVLRGTVQTVLPSVDPATRTVLARVELANPCAQLLPGMFIEVELATGEAEGLTVPTEAVIRTGRRSVVILAEQNGAFRPVDVTTGVETGERTEIVRGLEAGQRVVASGQFLIDSEASFRAAAESFTDSAAADAETAR